MGAISSLSSPTYATNAPLRLALGHWFGDSCEDPIQSSSICLLFAQHFVEASAHVRQLTCQSTPGQRIHAESRKHQRHFRNKHHERNTTVKEPAWLICSVGRALLSLGAATSWDRVGKTCIREGTPCLLHVFRRQQKTKLQGASNRPGDLL